MGARLAHRTGGMLGLFPPPLWGRLREGDGSLCAPVGTPTPILNPSPAKGRSRPSSPGYGGGEHGFIVVAVLWILTALATLATIFSMYVINTATAFAVHDERLQAEGLARAAIE